jgi:hypothetical protein
VTNNWAIALDELFIMERGGDYGMSAFLWKIYPYKTLFLLLNREIRTF